MPFPTSYGWAALGLQVPPRGPILELNGLNNLWIVTANYFTITSTAVAPTLDNIGGWPVMNLTNSGSTATDVSNMCVPVASLLLSKPGKRTWIRQTVQMTTATQDWAFGVGVVGTNMINADPTDFVMVRKLAAETVPSIRARKASGTAQTLACPQTMAASTWYTFAIEIIPDKGGTAGNGVVNLYGGTGIVPETGMLPLLQTMNVTGQFPDTVKLAPFMTWRAGSAANVSSYYTNFEVAQEAPANL